MRKNKEHIKVKTSIRKHIFSKKASMNIFSFIFRSLTGFDCLVFI